MFIAAHEWSRPSSMLKAMPPVQEAFGLSHLTEQKSQAGELSTLYKALSSAAPSPAATAQAADFLRQQISTLTPDEDNFPETPQELASWMQRNAEMAMVKYSIYLEERKAGAPRRFFSNRAHALYFLRAVSPTKLVDGSWLYGLLAHWPNPRFSDLLRTYLEELGEGSADKNHVVIYRQLLQRHGLEFTGELDDSFYLQGLIQLALAYNAEDFLAEVIGFNLAYEQLPLHLLITAYELNELGIDPYYFTLHVTVDNPHSGHAHRAVQAVLDNLPQIADAGDFWQRVKNGARLAEAGKGTLPIIEEFDIEKEVIRVFSEKSQAGHGAHSDYCRLAGRSINDWLAQASHIPEFLKALQAAGWIKLGSPVNESKFWGLLQGERAEMFGVFSGYELQLIHDWIRGSDSADGRAYGDPTTETRRPSFRVAARLALAQRQSFESKVDLDSLLDVDLQTLKNKMDLVSQEERNLLMLQALSPSHHWKPAGLYATQIFCKQFL